MSDVALMAATEWARNHTCAALGPVVFGHEVALVYASCRETELNGSAVAPVGDSVAAKVDALNQAAQEAQMIDAVLMSAGFSPTLSQKPLDDTGHLPVDAGTPDLPPAPQGSVCDAPEHLRKSAELPQCPTPSSRAEPGEAA